MKKVIESNGNFELSVDTDKNRLYIAAKGFWGDEKIADNYAIKQKEAINCLKKGFTAIADMSQYKTLPKALIPKQQESQRDLTKAGMFKIANIVSQSAIAKGQLDEVAKNTNMPVGSFMDMLSAEKWLDEEKA